MFWPLVFLPTAYMCAWTNYVRAFPGVCQTAAARILRVQPAISTTAFFQVTEWAGKAVVNDGGPSYDTVGKDMMQQPSQKSTVYANVLV